MTHTPGPWKVVIKDEVTHYPQIEDEENGHVLCRLTDLYCLPERVKANAHLMAASPDMLIALECVQALSMPYQEGLIILKSHGFDTTQRETSGTEFAAQKVAEAIAQATGG